MSDFERRLRDRHERASQLADPDWGWYCNNCGYHPESTSGWCAAGCGSDYNEMTKVMRYEIDPEMGVE